MSQEALRRVGIIGDVHAEDALLQTVLTFLKGVEPSLQEILCVGDVVSGSGDAGQAITLLREAGVTTVRGNHDRWFGHPGYEALEHFTENWEVDEAGKDWLTALPTTVERETVRGTLLLCHGIGSDDMSGVYPGDSKYVVQSHHALHALYGEARVRWIVCGHTHQRMLRTFDHLTIVNAGTLRRDRNPGFLIADFEAGTLQIFDLDPQTGAVTRKGERALL